MLSFRQFSCSDQCQCIMQERRPRPCQDLLAGSFVRCFLLLYQPSWRLPPGSERPLTPFRSHPQTTTSMLLGAKTNFRCTVETDRAIGAQVFFVSKRKETFRWHGFENNRTCLHVRSPAARHSAHVVSDESVLRSGRKGRLSWAICCDFEPAGAAAVTFPVS